MCVLLHWDFTACLFTAGPVKQATVLPLKGPIERFRFHCVATCLYGWCLHIWFSWFLSMFSDNPVHVYNVFWCYPISVPPLTPLKHSLHCMSPKFQIKPAKIPTLMEGSSQRPTTGGRLLVVDVWWKGVSVFFSDATRVGFSVLQWVAPHQCTFCSIFFSLKTKAPRGELLEESLVFSRRSANVSGVSKYTNEPKPS